MFFPVPVGDTYPRRTAPVLNILLIGANLAAFVYMFSRPEKEFQQIVDTYALHPDRWDNLKAHVTSMFMHGGLWHLLGNMFFLWAAGNSLEDRLGHASYLIFYLACGLAGAVTHVVMAMTLLPHMASIPTVGASGAISGVIGGHLAALPGNRIKIAIFPFLMWSLGIPVWILIPFWVALQVLMANAQLAEAGEGKEVTVAVFAHLGGFVLGFVFLLWLRLSGKMKAPRRVED